MTDQPRTPRPIQVAIEGTRADVDGREPAMLVAVQEVEGTWLIHPVDLSRAAIRITERDAARFATAILHLLPPHVIMAVQAAAYPQSAPAEFTAPDAL